MSPIFFLVFVKMVVLYVNQFHVLSNALGLNGHRLVNVLLNVVVHKHVINSWKENIALVMKVMWKLDHVVQPHQVTRKAVQHVNVSIQQSSNVHHTVVLPVKAVSVWKIHYLHINMYHQRMVNVVANVSRLRVSVFLLIVSILADIFSLLEPENCSVRHLPSDYVTVDNCVSTKKIAQQQCLGGCISQAMSGFDSSQNSCRCCAPAKTSTIPVELKCTDSYGKTKVVSKPYTVIHSCSCSVCGTMINA